LAHDAAILYSAGVHLGRPLLVLLASLAVASVATTGCRRSEGGATDGGLDATGPAAPEPPKEALVETRRAAATAKGATVSLPAGTFPLGSLPGDDGRDPTGEPLRYSASFQAFAIDALPFPNDPGAAVRRAATREEAETTCADAGGRLCTAAEWEYACAGASGQLYATGNAWNPKCAEDPPSCASSTGTRALSVEAEWVADGAKGEVGSRCAAFARVAAATPAEDDKKTGKKGGTGARVERAFRCCHGTVNAPAKPAIEDAPAYERAPVDAPALAAVLAGFPELSRIGVDQTKFFDPNDATTVISKGRKVAEKDKVDPRPADGFSFTTQPIWWSPEPGARYLVATGRGKSGSFVVVLHPLPGGKYRLASSFLFVGDFAPVALVYAPERRRDLSWSTCWGCVGENGGIAVRDDHHVVIVQN
jgi:hypothetical protein